MTLAAGTRLGSYEVSTLLGAGGMGEVYRARDPRLGRDVAIKVLPAAFAADPDRLRRFEQEARAAATISHPNVLVVYDVGVFHPPAPSEASGFGNDARPSSYLVSELLDGETLAARLRRGPLTVRRAVEFVVQIAHGLAAAHEKGILHRDLKPANIFVTTDERAKILDFGLAKLTESPEATGELSLLTATLPGVVLGTVGYMSPEQVRGQTIDQRSDIFAVGVLLFEMLSGRRAFPGNTAADAVSAILAEDRPKLPASERQIPATLVRIVDRCLEKVPAARFQTATDLAFALEGLLSASDHAPSSSPAPGKPHLLPWLVAATVLGRAWVDGHSLSPRAGRRRRRLPQHYSAAG
jgi:serine/threonine protein kinase